MNDLFPPIHLAYSVLIARFCGAAIAGAMIGYERQARNKTAGLRTHILVALSACVFAILALEIIALAESRADPVRIDPLRVIEAVTAGVGFLAAGTIVMARGRITGVTTGAGM
ncbi:MgtC/SapB family protein [Rhizobium rhizosphaerae]|nr:MgtC/SapB family protein [Xaviernesmea rhizosphaerae]